MVDCSVALSGLKYVALANSAFHVKEGLHHLEVCLCYLRRLVLLDLIEAQEGLFGLKLALE